ncbi:MAG TPA: hypothetical protein VHK01_15070 [Lacipirellulaceae bacterium]|nr:hypothetical protein [Lacipirellulaceae bacterium]
MGCLLKRTRERPQCDRKPDAFEAEHEALGGRPVRQDQAHGILVAALGMLAAQSRDALAG